MSSKDKPYNNNVPASSATVIPKSQWAEFLESFARSRQGWSTKIETRDTVTKEQVITSEAGLVSMELDLEDQRNPRINVSVKLDNKVVKHILFLPSRVVYRTNGEYGEESIEIETLNTETAVYVRRQG